MLDVETTKGGRTGAGAAGRAIAVVLIAAAIGLAVLYPFAHILHNRCLDLPSYYIAGKLALNGRNPYNPMELRMTAQALGMGSLVYPYIYFPMLALIFMPLSLVNYQLVQIGWFFLSQAFFWLSLVVIRSIGKTCYPSDPVAPAIRWMSLIVMASLSYPLVSNFMNGQVNTIILFLLSAFVLQLIKGLNIQAGILLGLVSMIKPQPLILFPYLLFKRRYRAAGAALATFVIGTAATATVIGWSNFRYYLREVLPTFNMVQTTFPPILIYAPANQSIHGLVFRLLHSTEYSTGFVQWPHLIRPIATVLVALVFCVSAWVIFRRQAVSPLQAVSIFRECAFLIVTSILLSPITWDHHLVIVTIAGASLLCCKPAREFLRPSGLLLIACWIVLMSPMKPFAPVWTAGPIAGLGISLKLFALAGFWALLAAELQAFHPATSSDFRSRSDT